MKNLLLLILLFATLACATVKKHSSQTELKVKDKTEATVKTDQVIKTEQQTKANTATAVKSDQVIISETATYGDSLQGQSFVLADDPAPFQVESKGLKLGITLKPKLTKDGKLLGYQVDYQATAKPIELKKQSIQQKDEVQVQQSTQTESKTNGQKRTKAHEQQSTRTEVAKVERQEENTGSRSFWLYLGAALALIIVLAVVLLRWWLKKQFSFKIPSL